MKYVVPEVSSCVRNLHFKLRFISTKCFLSVFTVSVQLEEGDWFIHIYIYAFYWSLCTCIFVHSVINSKSGEIFICCE